ncbi:hypothetical protein LIX60_22110 [Streptomyces sp. S07_1.15]|uniref:hypothetical protein n=1 Tax=Streptomyces sp. S07_1.15 TaxID=2873925 RepID=UPI001D147BD9|nr:hypothetical protein [Streptomyces sp. S07_1.15]MCC3654108.1 hypothetical protein [Streptomyces sp. S07_1.15]
MHEGNPEVSGAGLTRWSEEAHRNAVELAKMVGVKEEDFARDPLAALAGLQNYVSRLPLDQFEQSDWYTLHADLTSYLAEVLIRRRGAEWRHAIDERSPAGRRYFIEATGLDGERHRIEPYDVVMEEFRNLPVEISRMIANAEVALGVTRLRPED